MKQLTKILLLLIINCSLFINSGLAQNLVPNASFEQYDTCPDVTSQIHRATNWMDANTGTADYYNSCFTSGVTNVDVPNNFIGFQNAKTGVAYAGLMLHLYSPTPFHYREYIQAQLTSPLVNGVKYYVSFNISHADSSYYITDDIGIYLSSTQNNQGDYLNINVIPQIENTEGVFLSDDTNWTRIYGEYIASGGEEYITIGNFYDDFNTDTIRVKAGNQNAYLNAYYYIDDVCLSTDSMTCVNAVSIKQNTSLNNNYQILNSNGFIEIISNKNKPFNVSIFDLSGKLILQSFNESYNSRFDVNSLKSSIYIIRIYNDYENITQKILITN